MAKRWARADLPWFWPELVFGYCWLAMSALSRFVFHDDESTGHLAARIGLWLTLTAYVFVTLREFARRSE